MIVESAGDLHRFDQPTIFIGHGQGIEHVRRRAVVEANLDGRVMHCGDRAHVMSDLVLWTIGVSHVEHPVLEHAAGLVQAVVDDGQRQAEEGSDVALRALADVVKADDVAQLGREVGDGTMSGGMGVRLVDMVERVIVGSGRLLQRHQLHIAPTQSAVSVTTHDLPKPSGEGAGIRQ
ncbi:MAG: hypothetical protein WD009_00555 [Phycisphaeraceae bacterium]